MKKIVFIADQYYIKRSAIGNCIYNLTKELKEDYDIEVITLNKDLLDKSFVIVDGIKIHLLNTKLIKLEKKIKQNNYVIKKILLLIKFLFLVENKLFQPRRGFKDNMNCYLAALKNIGQIDYIIPTCMPIETCIAAYHYCKEHDCKYYPLLFDLFAYNKNMYRTVLWKAHRRKMNMAYEWLALNSSEILFTCNSWINLICDNYPSLISKVIPIEHPLIKFEDRAPVQHDEKEIIFAGNLLNGHNNLNDFINIFVKMPTSNSYKISIYSNLGAVKSDYDNISYYDWLDYDQYQVKLVNSLAVISLSEFNGKQLSSKIFECISHYKPIVQIVYTNTDANIMFLNKYPAAIYLNAHDNINLNVEKLEKWLLDIPNGDFNVDNLKRDFSNMTPEYVANQIKEAIVDKK